MHRNLFICDICGAREETEGPPHFDSLAIDHWGDGQRLMKRLYHFCPRCKYRINDIMALLMPLEVPPVIRRAGDR